MDVTERINFQIKGVRLCKTVKHYGLDGYICEGEKNQHLTCQDEQSRVDTRTISQNSQISMQKYHCATTQLVEWASLNMIQGSTELTEDKN